MLIDASTEKFELVTVLGIPMLFTCARVDRQSVPLRMFCYDVRHDDECQGIPCEIADYVFVNHWGTLISAREIELEFAGHHSHRLIDEEDWNYEGALMTLEDYAEEYC